MIKLASVVLAMGLVAGGFVPASAASVVRPQIVRGDWLYGLSIDGHEKTVTASFNGVKKTFRFDDGTRGTYTHPGIRFRDQITAVTGPEAGCVLHGTYHPRHSKWIGTILDCSDGGSGFFSARPVG